MSENRMRDGNTECWMCNNPPGPAILVQEGPHWYKERFLTKGLVVQVFEMLKRLCDQMEEKNLYFTFKELDELERKVLPQMDRLKELAPDIIVHPEY